MFGSSFFNARLPRFLRREEDNESPYLNIAARGGFTPDVAVAGGPAAPLPDIAGPMVADQITLPPLPPLPGTPDRGGPGPDEGGAATPYDDLTYRMIDGRANHDDDLGAAHTVFATPAGTAYSDGYNAPAGDGRPGAREISNMIFAQDDQDIPSTINASNFLWMWGQFLDHDLDLAVEGHDEDYHIAVPAGDSFFDPSYSGTAQIFMNRSAAADGTGTDSDHPRAQTNSITAFIDASNVYGSDDIRAAALRAPGGYLKLDESGYLPLNEDGLPNANANPDLQPAELFLAGDVRANENVALTTMHTLFVREHNRLVDELKSQYPDMDAESLYQNAKATVEAYMQAITYNEFLPLIIGESALESYNGYDPALDPQITSEFATATFRIGHSMLSGTIARLEENGQEAAHGPLALRDAFFTPAEISQNGIDTLLRGQAATTSQEIDHFVIDDVRNFLFGPPGTGGFDLVSLNIQRGRDHGLPDYNSVREAYGLGAYSTFEQITSDPQLAAQLEALYGDINNIDLYVGGLAENPVSGALVGETFQAILAHQFTALRDGDRFWYQDRFDGEFLEDIESTRLSDIIRRNSDIEYLQQDIFIASTRIGGTAGRDRLEGGAENDLILGMDGRDLLYGFDGDDTLYGGAGHDLLKGGRGDDALNGGAGRDLLMGGSGNDSFTYDAFDRIIGGDGLDTLLFGAEEAGPFDFDGPHRITGIEIFDFNNGAQDTVYLAIEDILRFADDNDLYIRGDDGQDHVVIENYIPADDTQSAPAADGSGYIAYTQNSATLFIEQGLIIHDGAMMA